MCITVPPKYLKINNSKSKINKHENSLFMG